MKALVQAIFIAYIGFFHYKKPGRKPFRYSLLVMIETGGLRYSLSVMLNRGLLPG